MILDFEASLAFFACCVRSGYCQELHMSANESRFSDLWCEWNSSRHSWATFNEVQESTTASKSRRWHDKRWDKPWRNDERILHFLQTGYKILSTSSKDIPSGEVVQEGIEVCCAKYK
jgi:hypothetical protein